MEPAWSDDLAARVRLAEEIVANEWPAGEVTFIAIKHGARIIAASSIRDSGDKVSNLPLGVCVLNEYRCRGLGTYLLHESLRRLKERGLEEARAGHAQGSARRPLSLPQVRRRARRAHRRAGLIEGKGGKAKGKKN